MITALSLCLSDIFCLTNEGKCYCPDITKSATLLWQKFCSFVHSLGYNQFIHTWPGQWQQGDHTFTCHPLTNHTGLYSPAAQHHRFLAGTHYAYLRRDGQAELTRVAGRILTEWPWMAVSHIARYLCGSWASCLVILRAVSHTDKQINKHIIISK